MGYKFLVVVDMQNDFVYGPLGSERARNIVQPMKADLDNYDKIIFTQDTHLGSTYDDTEEGKNIPVKHCLVGTEGREIIEPFQKFIDKHRTDRKVIGIYEKDTFGSVRLGETIHRLKDKIDSITFVGVCTDICVISNVLLTKAFAPDIPIYVIECLTSGSTYDLHLKAIEVMKSCNVHII